MLSAYKEKTLKDENGMTFSPSGSFLIKVKKIEIRYFYPSKDGMNKKTPDATVSLRRYFLNHIPKCCTVPQELLSQFTSPEETVIVSWANY